MKTNMDGDKLIIGGYEFNSRFILGSGKYDVELIKAAIKDAGAEEVYACCTHAVLSGPAVERLDSKACARARMW